MIVAVGGIPTDYGKDTVQTTNSPNTGFSATEWASWRRKLKWYVCLNNFDLIYLRRFIVCKNHEKDYSLLRPFDLEAAKRGDFVETTRDDEIGRLIAENNSEIVIDFERSGFVIYEKDDLCQLCMTPLCWVEGRPVYKGDVLYWNMNPMLYKAIATDEGFKFDDGSLRTYESVYEKSFFTWTPPKVKREGWMNCYETGFNYVYPTKEKADAAASYLRIALVHLKWEE